MSHMSYTACRTPNLLCARCRKAEATLEMSWHDEQGQPDPERPDQPVCLPCLNEAVASLWLVDGGDDFRFGEGA